MSMNRREALKLGLSGTGVLFSPLSCTKSALGQAEKPCPIDDVFKKCTTMADQQTPIDDRPSPLAQERFQQDLPIPKPLQKQLSNNGIDYYEIVMRKEQVELRPAQNGQPAYSAEFWTYNGSIPGPLIHVAKDQPSCIRFINQLGNDEQNKPICTSVHLHGMASLPQYDGYAEDLTPPEHYKDYYYPNMRASILWYHDHAVHHTSRNVYKGLAGMYIVDYEPSEDFCDHPAQSPLPSGEFEIPLVIQDKAFEKHPDSSRPNELKLVFNDLSNHRGVYADVLLMNGKPWPKLKVQRRKYFFRILNASASRTYQLVLSPSETDFPGDWDEVTKDGKPAQLMVVGSDAGLLAHPVLLPAPSQPLRIGVAERYGVIIDFAQFDASVKQVFLRNLPFSGNLGVTFSALLRFDLEEGTVNDPFEIPPNLGIVTPRDAMRQQAVSFPPTEARKRVFQFGRGRDWTINGKTWDKGHIAVQPNLCDIEVWTLQNMGGWTHPVHVHLVDFRILSRNGRDPYPYEQGWKDVVLLRDFEQVQVMARFAPHKGKYMVHCHNIVHEDHDMMTQFEVVTRNAQGEVMKNSCDIDPLADPAKSLPAPKLGSNPPPPPVSQPLPICSSLPIPQECRES